ncbi:MAG: chloride channel protein [Spirochaetae bacterium HGW-Spirochaetae-4]|nr:MAG: chloride channel protein [Spirochaetae bacterium HGW-Spirochaetae-8]PKL21833.1 MAG: chloride channel protein [Spirochaetae bacterium HGW-Spirochaetae-4]HCG63048.1 chloride channel protein [Sphaerochaeta sp.]
MSNHFILQYQTYHNLYWRQRMRKTKPEAATQVYDQVLYAENDQIRRTIHISLLCILVGAIAGLGAVGFKYLIEFFHNLFFQGELSFEINRGGTISKWGPFIIFVPAIGIAIAQKITQVWAPEAKGHGVPEVMVAVAENRGRIRPIVALVKSLASAITIGAGGSVGKEGPIVQIGASFGSTLGQTLKLSSRETIILVGAGVAGGISATFNAPIGGIMFALELILPEYSIMTIMPLVISAIIATTVGTLFMGAHPAFMVPEYTMVSPYELIFYVLLGLAAGVLSVIFIKSVYGMEDFFDSIRIPATVKALAGGLVVGGIGYVSLLWFGNYHVYGVGYDFLDLMLDNKITALGVALALVLMKLLANTLTLAAGGSGGIFAPSLFLGGALGGAVGILVNTLFPETTGPVSAYAIVGMAAIVSGVTGGVLTAIIMVFEMTRDYAIMLPLMLSAVLSYFVSKSLYKETMYTKKLTRRGIQIQFDKRIPTFKTLAVGEIMKREMVSCSPDDTVASVLETMHSHALGLLPVIDGNHVLGTISYAELYANQPGQDEKIASMVHRQPITIPSSSNLYDALKVMKSLETNILIVTSGDDIEGFVTANRIIRNYLEKKQQS